MKRTEKVAIIGQGYVGLPLAMMAVSSGYSVIGLENDSRRLSQLSAGKSYIEDVSNEELHVALKSGEYVASEDYKLVSRAKYVIFCLPTPIDDSNNPDLSILSSAISSTAPHLTSDSVVISESTSFPGTLRNIIKPNVVKMNTGKFHFAVAPERVDPANNNFTPKQIPRLVSGIDKEGTRYAKEFYESLGLNVVTTTSPEIAEAAKLLENTFRQVNIALVNEFAKISAAIGIDVREIIEAANTKPYGFMRFNPGPGVGGHCIPVDPHYLTWISREHGFAPDIIELANKINDDMPHYVVNRFNELFPNGLTRKHILVAGLAYKHGVADFRESPALKIIDSLKDLGAKVSWYDSLIKEYRGTENANLNATYDGILITLPNLELPVERWLLSDSIVFDCTGYYRRFSGVNQL